MSLLLWVAALAIAAVGVSGQPWRTPWWTVPALLFAASLAWRDNGYLRFFDVIAIGLALSMPYWRPARWSRVSVGEAGLGMATCGVHAMFGALPLLFTDVRWHTFRQAGAWRHLIGVGLGLLIALPAVLIFGGLFMAADAGFEALVTGLLHFDADALMRHTFVITFVAWGVAGYMRRLLPAVEYPALPAAVPFRLGLIEAITVLLALDALFGVFVALQLPYLFGGAANAEALSYATYARRGFFELAWVTALAMPLLWGLHALTGDRTGAGARIFTALSGFWVLLLGVVIASAAHRMLLYQAAYGLTELRVYVLAFECWMAVLLAWFAGTVLAGGAGDRRTRALLDRRGRKSRPAYFPIGAPCLSRPRWRMGQAPFLRQAPGCATHGRDGACPVRGTTRQSCWRCPFAPGAPWPPPISLRGTMNAP